MKECTHEEKKNICTWKIANKTDYFSGADSPAAFIWKRLISIYINWGVTVILLKYILQVKRGVNEKRKLHTLKHFIIENLLEK